MSVKIKITVECTTMEQVAALLTLTRGLKVDVDAEPVLVREVPSASPRKAAARRKEKRRRADPKAKVRMLETTPPDLGPRASSDLTRLRERMKDGAVMERRQVGQLIMECRAIPKDERGRPSGEVSSMVSNLLRRGALEYVEE